MVHSVVFVVLLALSCAVASAVPPVPTNYETTVTSSYSTSPIQRSQYFAYAQNGTTYMGLVQSPHVIRVPVSSLPTPCSECSSCGRVFSTC